MMSATIIDRDTFCRSIGIPQDQVEFLSIDSPFPVENRPILYFPAGSMAKEQIDLTLPKMAEMIKALLDEHKNEKGIIHCHSYKIADYMKKNVKNSRLLFHDSQNREEVVKKHFESSKSTVLVSPSLSEGIDLKDDLSRWQVICKIPFPYLGDKIVRKRMHRDKDWYSYQTAKSIVQSIGRSVRSETDHAATYILDENWSRFFTQHQNFFPGSFKAALLR
jgi:Rad3-related DNA helicase